MLQIKQTEQHLQELTRAVLQFSTSVQAIVSACETHGWKKDISLSEFIQNVIKENSSLERCKNATSADSTYLYDALIEMHKTGTYSDGSIFMRAADRIEEAETAAIWYKEKYEALLQGKHWPDCLFEGTEKPADS